MTQRRWVYLVLVLIGAQGLLAATTPVTVSPGQAKAMVPIESRCPTFSWGVVPDAESYELVVYQVDREGEVANAVLRQRVTGTANGWTPALDQCLKRGSRYAWSVRAVAEYGDTEWSPPSLFEVSAGPSAAEVEEALALLQRYRDHQRQRDTGESAEARPTVGDATAVVSSTRVSEQKPDRVKLPQSIGRVERVFSGPAERAGGIAAAAPTASATPSLTVDDQIHLAAESDVFKGGAVFLWDDSSGNTGIGRAALPANTTGHSNTASGYRALFSNTTGYFNTASGYKVLYSNTAGTANTATGAHALLYNATGSYNTASGFGALYKNTTGYQNTGSGVQALINNTTGSQNTASGAYALRRNTTGGKNTASGAYALYANTTGYANTASGYRALSSNTTGKYNLAIGFSALGGNTTGNDNIAVGERAGVNVTSGSDNIHIGNRGVNESNTIRIGNARDHSKTVVAGIRGTTTGQSHPIAVLIDSNGQLGTISSSRRYKEEIADMGAASEQLLSLRPVTFRYKKEFADGEKPIQFGLIAEEVAEVFPELVVYDGEGRPETVKYHLLSTLLLNELQEERQTNDAQARMIDSQALRLTELSALKERLAELEDLKARLARLEAREIQPPRMAAVADRSRSSPVSGGR